MCTVSVVRCGDGVRLVCNRDEQRTRPPARPPLPSTIAVGEIVYPIDPLSGGTWAGVKGGRFAAALLNRRVAGEPVDARPSSRGTIVPAILSCASFDTAMSAAMAIDGSRFAPFTLLIVDAERAAVMSSDDMRFPELLETSMPLMRTSSSLGDAFVDSPRRALFAAMVQRTSDPLTGQHAFHRHRWPERRDVSVVMSRRDARTVSRMTIDLTSSGAAIAYEDSPC